VTEGIDETTMRITERTARTHVSNILGKLGLAAASPVSATPTSGRRAREPV
jgi:hypothetical protein